MGMLLPELAYLMVRVVGRTVGLRVLVRAQVGRQGRACDRPAPRAADTVPPGTRHQI